VNSTRELPQVSLTCEKREANAGSMAEPQSQLFARIHVHTSSCCVLTRSRSQQRAASSEQPGASSARAWPSGLSSATSFI